MASNHTSNYGLSQWEATDAVLRTDFNEDNAKIDAALKSQAGSISSLSAQMVNKANTGTVSSLSSQLNQEIQDRQDAVEAESSARQEADTAEAEARSEAIAELAGRLELKGNCQICYTTYVGDGAMERTLTFDGRPLLVEIMEGYRTFTAIQGTQYAMSRTSNSGDFLPLTWSGNSIAWKVVSSGANYEPGFNMSGRTYYAVVLMAADE